MATTIDNVVFRPQQKFFWNYSLSKPVTCTLHIYPTREQTDVLSKARVALSEIVQCVTEQQQLSSEFFVLNRLLYMKHGQFRREKTYQGLKQIRTCLRRYLSFGLGKLAKNYLAHLENVIIEEGICVYLPTYQMWEYLLTHFLGTSALISSTASRCETVFLDAYRHLKAGHLIPTNVIFLALLSRTWMCCRSLLVDLQTWYSALRPVLDILQPAAFAWLPEGCKIPDHLDSWMVENNLNTGYADRNIDVDETTALLTQYAQIEDGTEAEENGDVTLPDSDNFTNGVDVVVDQTTEALTSDDFGDPVSLSDIEASAIRKCTLTGLKKKVEKASSARKLQLLLKRFGKRFPELTTAKKCKKCAAFLSGLETRTGVMEVRGNQDGIRKLLVRGRNKLLKLINGASDEPAVVQDPQTAENGLKRRKKARQVQKVSCQEKKTKKLVFEKGNESDALQVKRDRLTEKMTKVKKKKQKKTGVGVIGVKVRKQKLLNQESAALQSLPSCQTETPAIAVKRDRLTEKMTKVKKKKQKLAKAAAGPIGVKVRKQKLLNQESAALQSLPSYQTETPAITVKRDRLTEKMTKVKKKKQKLAKAGAGPIGVKVRKQNVLNQESAALQSLPSYQTETPGITVKRDRLTEKMTKVKKKKQKLAKAAAGSIGVKVRKQKLLNQESAALQATKQKLQLSQLKRLR